MPAEQSTAPEAQPNTTATEASTSRPSAGQAGTATAEAASRSSADVLIPSPAAYAVTPRVAATRGSSVRFLKAHIFRCGDTGLPGSIPAHLQHDSHYHSPAPTLCESGLPPPLPDSSRPCSARCPVAHSIPDLRLRSALPEPSKRHARSYDPAPAHCRATHSAASSEARLAPGPESACDTAQHTALENVPRAWECPRAVRAMGADLSPPYSNGTADLRGSGPPRTPSVGLRWSLKSSVHSLSESWKSLQRSSSPVSSTRSNFACCRTGMFAISSRNKVPPFASSKRPIRSTCASVKAPLHMAEQFALERSPQGAHLYFNRHQCSLGSATTSDAVSAPQPPSLSHARR